MWHASWLALLANDAGLFSWLAPFQRYSFADEKEAAALEFTRKATDDPKTITKEDIETLQQYYADGEIIEIVTVIQQFMGYNWFVTILGLELEGANPMKR